MVKWLRLSFVDFRFLLKAKELWIAIAVVMIYTCALSIYSINASEQRTMDYYYQIINDLSFYVFIIVPSFILSKDYAFKTTRILYTGPFSKLEVVSSKFFSVLLFYVIASIVHRVSANSLWLVDQRVFSAEFLWSQLPKTMVIYLLIGIFVCLLAFLVTLATYSRMATIIVMLTIFIMEKYLRGILLLIFPHEHLKILLTHNPVAIAFEALQYGTITLMDGAIVVFTSVVISLLAFLVLKRREIN